MKGLVVSNVPPPLLGFNNNVRHRGRIFHIQTEDSGLKSPRVVTHLFADGGRIIKTTRTDYAEHVSRPDVQAFVRSLMKEQHKGMFTALRQGELDTLLEAACGAFEQPLQVSSKAPPPELVSAAPPPGFVSAAPSALLTASVQPTVRAPTEFETPPLASAFGDEERVSERATRPASLTNPNLRRVTPSVPLPSTVPLDVDVAALDRLPTRLAPPPDVATLSGSPRAPHAAAIPPAPPTTAIAPARGPRPNPAQVTPGGTAPGLSRPSSRFAAAPPTSSTSIFGDGAISEQSLDEVILSYLAEDLDGSSE